eukprot:317619-Pyramimonas_sp.AAC.1
MAGELVVLCRQRCGGLAVLAHPPSRLVILVVLFGVVVVALGRVVPAALLPLWPGTTAVVVVALVLLDTLHPEGLLDGLLPVLILHRGQHLRTRVVVEAGILK